MQRIVLTAAGLLFSAAASGCALNPADYPEADTFEPADHGDTFSLRTDGGHVVVATVGAQDVVSADVSLSRYPSGAGSALRGRAFGAPVSVETAGEHVAGLAGASPLDLQVTRDDRGLHLAGLVRGALSDFHVGDHAAQGKLGACSYELARAALAYEGRRSCGGKTEGVTLKIPRSLGLWSDDERAAVLAVLLGGG